MTPVPTRGANDGIFSSNFQKECRMAQRAEDDMRDDLMTNLQ